MASFSAQFPPPEWSRPSTSGLHGHSRSTQTRHAPHVVPPESNLASSSQWLPRSSSLSRHPNRPISAASLHFPDVSSSGPSPSHRHRNQSPSPSRVPQDSTTTHNPAYFNPYRNMTFRSPNNTSKYELGGVNSQTQFVHTDPYGYANDAPIETGLPPRPPPFVSHDAVHRRTLSASPRRIVNLQQASLLGQRGSPQRCAPQERYKRLTSHTLPTDASVPPQLREDNGLNKHALSNSFSAVYDAHDKIYNDVNYHYNNAHSAQNFAYSLNEVNQRSGRDGSPQRRVNESPYRTTYQSPSRPKNYCKASSLSTEENATSNLSSSIDSGILPDQRSSNRDSSEDRNRSATTSVDQNTILENFDEILTVEVTEESKNKHKSRLEVRCRTEDHNEELNSASTSREDKDEKLATDNPRKVEVTEKYGPENSKLKNLPKKSNNSTKQQSSNCNAVKSSNSGKARPGSKETSKYNRSALQLDLVNSNTKKMAAQRRDQNVLPDLNKYSKIQARDLTSKNLGYRDTNKCEKKMYLPNQSAAARSGRTSYSQQSVKQFESPIKKKAMKSKLENKSEKKKPPKCESIDQKEDSNKTAQQHQNHLSNHRPELSKSPDQKSKISQVVPVESVSVGDNNSVRTYPSLSELNFSSLAAQKILRGVSVNSIDTLLEVNLAAGETTKNPGPVTNTNFGYL